MRNSLIVFGLFLLLLTVVVAPIALVLAFVGAITAPLHSPQTAQDLLCPPGTTINVEWYQATWNQPGEQTLSVSCVDADGGHLPAAEDAASTGRLTARYFVWIFGLLFIPLALLLALLVALVWLWRRRRAA
jgi:ABC-type sugar transport system permease subunit